MHSIRHIVGPFFDFCPCQVRLHPSFDIYALGCVLFDIFSSKGRAGGFLVHKAADLFGKPLAVVTQAIGQISEKHLLRMVVDNCARDLVRGCVRSQQQRLQIGAVIAACARKQLHFQGRQGA